MEGMRCCSRCIYLGVVGGCTGMMECKAQVVDPRELLVTISQIASQVDGSEYSAINAAILSEFLILVRNSGYQMSPRLYLEEAGATFTCEFWDKFLAIMKAKRDGNASVVDTSYFIIQFGIEIDSFNVSVTCELWCSCGSTWCKACCTNEEDKIVMHNLAIGFGGKEDADVTKVKLQDASMLESDMNLLAIAGRLFKTVFKGHLCLENSGIVAMRGPAPSLKFCNMLKVKFIDNSRTYHMQTLKFIKDIMILGANPGGSFNDVNKTLTDVPRMQQPLPKEFIDSECLDDKKMVFEATRDKQPLVNSKVDAKLEIFVSSRHPTKSRILLQQGRLQRACWMWLFILVILLPTSRVNSAEDSPSSKQGSCCYDLTSVATLSCVQPSGAWLPPSATCCKALLYAIDHVLSNGESGACCLGRYVRANDPSSKLVTDYVRCKGKDRRAVAKLLSSPITTCLRACRKGNISSLNMGTFGHKDHLVVHGAGNGIFKILSIAIATAFVMGLICFWYFWRFKLAANPSERYRRLSQSGGARGGRRKYSTGSSTELKG